MNLLDAMGNPVGPPLLTDREVQEVVRRLCAEFLLLPNLAALHDRLDDWHRANKAGGGDDLTDNQRDMMAVMGVARDAQEALLEVRAAALARSKALVDVLDDEGEP